MDFSFGLRSALKRGRKEGNLMKTKVLAMMLVAAGSMFAQARVSVGVGVGAAGGGYYPQGPSYAANIPPSPGPGYIWADGYWSQNYGGSVWVPGYWYLPAFNNSYYGGYSSGYYGGGYYGGGYYGGSYYGGGYYPSARFSYRSNVGGGRVEQGRTFSGQNRGSGQVQQRSSPQSPSQNQSRSGGNRFSGQSSRPSGQSSRQGSSRSGGSRGR
jgi:WXXGXW repeat (2 copies)